MRVLLNVYSCFVCLNVYFFYSWNVYIAEPATNLDSLLNERARNGERDIGETTCIRIHFVFSFCLSRSSFVCICICCCFKRRWIQFTKMPGGRRGLVAPQNTFLENIIRRSNSQRKYIRFSSLFFSAVFFHSYTIGYTHTRIVRLRNCKWFDQRVKK